MASEENDNRLDEIIKLIKGVSMQHNADFQKLDARLTNFEKSMSFINNQFENFKKTTENILKANIKLEKRNEELTEELKQVKKELGISKKHVDDLEQYGRRDCVEFNGIPQEQNEDVENLVIKTGIMLDIHIDSKDIQACHRMGKKQDAPIICTCLNRKTATAFLKAKSQTKKSFKGEKLGLKEHPDCKIYINESLTKRNKELLYKVRMKKLEKNWKFVWSRNGTIYTRKDENSEFVRINDEKDILKMV